MKIIGIADTTFSRVNMGAAAEDELKATGTGFRTVRMTVPGIKDLPVACKTLFERDNCDIVIACGMPGPKSVDKMSTQIASTGLMQVQLMTGKHILEVFVHEDEADSLQELSWLSDRRVREHATNAYDLLFNPGKLISRAGTGQRQGFEDVGPAVRTK